MAFLDKTGLQTLTNKLVQGDAIKVASHRGRTVENVIDNITRECGNVPTPLEYKIENRVTDFRIGQGRDVDVSGDVEKGYTEVELQGKTIHNLFSYEENKVIGYFTHGKIATNLLKPNTTYTLFSEGVNFNKHNVRGIAQVSYSPARYTNLFTANKNRIKFTTNTLISHNTWTDTVCIFLQKKEDNSNESSELVYSCKFTILEGDHTQTPIEELPQYFEGIQSSFEDGVVAVRSGEQEYTASIGEPLRSLPNGTSDEISNGKLIRRVGKVVLDGSGSWRRATDINGEKYYFAVDIKNIPQVKEGLYTNNQFSDRFYIKNPYEYADEKCIWVLFQQAITRVRISLGDISETAELKQWLQANPTTVYYELETPIITPVDPIKFETQPLGSIEINSEIPPTSFHTVQLNRAAQIERGITEIAELKNRVEILETMYDSHFLETAHKLELLGMDYELESEEI